MKKKSEKKTEHRKPSAGIHYSGWFFDPASLYTQTASLTDPLEKRVKAPHITFRHLDQNPDWTLLGENAGFEITGVGNDGINAGVKVKMVSGSQKAKAAFDQIIVPHITLFLSKEGKAKDTAKLNFETLEDPIRIEGRFGIMDNRGIVHFD